MTSPVDESLGSRLERVFASVFAGRLAFSMDLARRGESRWDSLKHIELLIALEREFGLRFDGSDATEMDSVPRIIELLEHRLG